MIILGLATMGTSAACLMRDGGIVAAIEEERLSRIKNDGAFPLRAVAECLRVAGVTMAEVDAVAVYWMRWRIGTRAAGTLGKAMASPAARRAIAARTRRALIGGPDVESRPEDTGRWSDLFRVRRILKAEFGACPADVTFHDHHLTHQLYGEATRGWPACLSLSYDGGGEADATVLSLVEDGRRTDLKRVRWPNSLGHFYSFFTGWLGFRMLEGEYKMMGLAPYGRPAFRDAILDRLLRLEDDGGYRLDTALCDYHRALAGDFDPGLAEIVGPPRAPDAEPDQNHLDLAASVQAAFEAAQRHLLAWGKAQAPQIDRLVLSGGCALNVTANGRVLQSGLFSEIIAPPAPHDAGCAVGRGAGARRRGPERPLALSRPRLHRRGDRADLRRSRPARPARPRRGRADRGRRRGARRGRRRRLVPGPHRVRAARAGVALDPCRSARRRDPRDDQRQDQEARALPPLRPLDDDRGGARLVRSRPGQPLHEHPGRGPPGETRPRSPPSPMSTAPRACTPSARRPTRSITA